jgi:hypothetical protein
MVWIVGDQPGEQAPDLVERQRNRRLAGDAAVAVAFAAAITVRMAWASMTSVTCRYQEG